MTTSTPLLTLYDIASRPPRQNTCFAPNPWKARLALNFKALPYQTAWVPLPDIPHLRSQTLRLPPARSFADGTPFHTLPILYDPNASSPPGTDRGTASSTGLLLGDSFDIATHLERQYPLSGAGSLFPPQNLDFPSSVTSQDLLIPLSDIQHHSPHVQYALFNNRVDALFTSYTLLAAYNMPLDPPTADLAKAEFVRRAGLSSWEDFHLVGEPRQAMMLSFRDTLRETLAPLFRRDDTGPFLLGATASYADLIVGAWLRMMQRTLSSGEWEQVRGWHEGIFGRLHDALDEYAEVK
ncbi:hypothetical protein E4U43_003233 [Claviceps pusilla]|uniref:GST N-terminal domain-containing protein n=1 Tax=Claviceps pusilla TaxID=123648 RepID=A0A9P7N5N9_9HYPO|nr:hypothetical protein E4U43_003233 [Claviceps pusilla]